MQGEWIKGPVLFWPQRGWKTGCRGRPGTPRACQPERAPAFLQDFVSAGITPYFLLLPHHLDFFMVLFPFFPAAAFPTAT
jgi:hypothetical protein